MIEAGATSTEEVELVQRVVLATPGIVILAPPEIPRNVQECKVKTAPNTMV
jgi:hypothetical protein